MVSGQKFAMLSRVANSIFWMARYVERVENVARFIDVALNVILDQPRSHTDQHWEPLVRTTGDEEYFEEHYQHFTSENVRQFLTFDQDYSNSIISSLALARENARTVREAISSEAWEQLNDFYHFVLNSSKHGGLAATPDFYAEVKRHSVLFNGILDASMSRGKGWHFANIGRHLERADKTSRILDVKYFTLLPRAADVNTTYDDLLWSAVLRSVSGFEMFRKRYHSLTVERVIEFLVLDPRFPRAIRYCADSVLDSLQEVSSGSQVNGVNTAIEQTEQLIAHLKACDVLEMIRTGLHEHVDTLQSRLNLIGEQIHDTFFAMQPFEDSPLLHQSQRQS